MGSFLGLLGASRPGKLICAAQKLAGALGVGLIRVDNPDYIWLCGAYRTLTLARQRGDFTTIVTMLDRDFQMIHLGQIRISRAQYEARLRVDLLGQVESEYREEPAHFVIRGERAEISSRVYGRSICHRDGRLLETRERGEHVTTWAKYKTGWKMIRTRVRSYEQHLSWATDRSSPGEKDGIRTPIW